MQYTRERWFQREERPLFHRSRLIDFLSGTLRALSRAAYRVTFEPFGRLLLLLRTILIFDLTR